MGNVKFLSQAVNLASQSEHRSFKHGAILVKGGKVLSEGVNKYTIGTHGLHAHSEHAEENALRGKKNYALGSTMYIARVASYGHAMSKPCHRCQILLKNAGVKKVIYTSKGGNMQAMFI